MFRARFLRACLAFCAASLASAPAGAQESLRERVDNQLKQLQRETRLMPNPDVPPAVRASVDYGLYLTPSFIQVDDAFVRGRRQFENDVTAFARVDLDGVHTLFARGVLSHRDQSPFGDPEQEGWDGHVERLFYRFDLARAMAANSGEVPSGGFAVQIGRDLQYWGTGLTLVRELDAVTLDLTLENRYGLRLLAGTTPRDSIDIDQSRPGYLDDTHRDFFGALASGWFGNHRPFAYALVQRDHNDGSITTASSDDGVTLTTRTTRFDYNSVYYGIGSTGALSDRLAYGAEVVCEFGSGLSRNPDSTLDGSHTDGLAGQSRESVRAFAANLQLDYLLPDEGHSRLSGNLIFATGDEDRINSTNTIAGNEATTDDRAFNGFGLLNTGLAFNPDASNLLCLRCGASTFPFRGQGLLGQLQTGFDFYAYFKPSTGGVDEPSTDSSYLGVEPDIYINWQITSDLTLALRYGVFFPGEGLRENDDERHAVYVSLTFAL
jgi:hypothetical protein